jgi:DUF2075 family protein
MTDFEVERLAFTPDGVGAWAPLDVRNNNWPVVYVLDENVGESATFGGLSDVYVGESLNAAGRMRQHLISPDKQHLKHIRVILAKRFNKSVCLDLESYLIRLLAGDGAYRVLNRNDGITDSNYFDRESYQATFDEVFEQLRRDGIFTRTIPEIVNSDLFKLSPFKALTSDQAVAVEGIVEGLFEDLEAGRVSTTVVQGEPGTGKTVVAIFLLKLLEDIAHGAPIDDLDSDHMFAEFFVTGYGTLVADLRIAIVVPQQSLRESIKRVFRKTPGLSSDMVLTAFEVGESPDDFDLLIVDESHRLNQRANQPSGVQNKRFRDITLKLFGADDTSKTQLDWIRAKSRHQMFLVDSAQSVRPADLPLAIFDELAQVARSSNRFYRLVSQMRVKAGSEYVASIREILSDSGASVAKPLDLGEYDLRLFDDLPSMIAQIRLRDAEAGLSRLVAGYAWPWASKSDKAAFDIEIDDVQLRWNSTQVDWIASPKSIEEVGSIHTVQGYDLNYAGVIIGPDLRYDAEAGRLVFHRESYFDVKGKENNPLLGKKYDDADLLRFVANIYAVLLTRGILGTYVYIVDPPLREYVRGFMPIARPGDSS